jgi:putative tricarboxylic transport membrane protein
MHQLRRYFQEFARRGEFIIPLSFLVVSIFLLYLSTQFRTPVRFAVAVGPAFFPQAVLAAIMILSAKLIYDYLRADSLRKFRQFDKVENPRNLWITLAFMLAYVLLLGILGFVVLTPIWVGAYMYAVGIRRWKLLVPTTVILSALLIVVFPVLFKVPLPRGIGIFRTISILVY